MNVFAFIAAMTGALAWPLVIVVALVLFRHSIKALFEKLSSLHLGNLGAEFDTESAAAASTGVPIAASAAHSGAADDELLALATRSPRLAIIEMATRVETAIRTLASKSIKHVENRAPGVLIRALEGAGIIDRSTAHSLQGLFVMRNLAVHGPEADVTTQRAVDFIYLANAILFVLSTKG